MASTQARIGQQAMVVLDVALRVPCVFIIDAIFNSYYDPGSGWAGAAGKVFARVTGVAVCGAVLVLSQRALLRLYGFLLALILAFAAALVCHHTAAAAPPAYLQALFPRGGPAAWLALALVQLTLATFYAALLDLRPPVAALVALDVSLPVCAQAAGLPVAARRSLSAMATAALLLGTAAWLVARLGRLYYACRYVRLLLGHMYRLYGLQLLLEDTWRRCRLPHVLRLFWLTRITVQALILLYVLRDALRQGGGQPQARLLSWEVLWEMSSTLVISGCDSTLTVLGMSAVISSLAHYLGLAILAFIGSTEEEDKRLGFVAPVLFFILALQTGLSSLQPEERLVRLSRNMCLLLTAVLHFVHGMADPVLMSLSASHVSSPRRHLPVLLVSLALLALPVALSHALWHHHALNTWLFAVTAFCVELCLKVVVSLMVYSLFMVDGFYNVLWEQLDDYVYYVRSTGNVVEFLFGVVMFGNGAYTMMFEAGSKIRACMMCLHAYFNIYLQAKNGWRTFINRRTAVKKINGLPEVRGEELRGVEDVCAICYQEFLGAARVTPCRHYFHAMCLRKWLYIQDSCPMCHQRIYVDHAPPQHALSNNNPAPAGEGDGAAAGVRGEGAGGGGGGGGEGGEDEQQEVRPAGAAVAAVAARPRGRPGPGDELMEDNDSIEYDEEEWTAQGACSPLEEEYINDDTDSTGD